MTAPTAPLKIQLSTQVSVGQPLPQPIRFLPKMVDPALDTSKFDTIFFNGNVLLSDALFAKASILGVHEERVAMGDRRTFEKLLQLSAQLNAKLPASRRPRARARAHKNMKFLVDLYFPRGATIRMLGESFRIDGAEAISLPGQRPEGAYQAIVDLRLTPLSSAQQGPVRGYSLHECRRRRLVVQKRIYNSLWDHKLLQAYFAPGEEQPDTPTERSLPAHAPARRGTRHESAIRQRPSQAYYPYGHTGWPHHGRQRYGGTRRRGGAGAKHGCRRRTSRRSP